MEISPLLNITRKDREKVLGQKGTVLWFTGLPCSGKTTLATQLQSLLFQNTNLVYSLDGDQFRKGVSFDLDFSREGRKENIRRIGEISKLFADAGLIVIIAVISPYQSDREKVRRIFEPEQFIEIFLDCSLEECERRDIKGHYRLARRGEIPTGVSSPYESPTNPEICLKTDKQSIEECLRVIVEYLNNNNIVNNETAVKSAK